MAKIIVNLHTEFICEYDGVAVFAYFVDGKFKSLFEIPVED